MSNHAKRKQKAVLVVALVLLILGCGFLLAPLASNVLFRNEVSSQIDEVYQVRSLAEDNEIAEKNKQEQNNSLLNSNAERLLGMRDYFESYNKQIANGERLNLSDPFNQAAKAANDFGLSNLSDDPIGVIEISAMDCNLPLYLGASSEHMAQGAAIVTGTSVPLGGESTNSVIAAHRGWRQLSMFRDIERLKVGDSVVLHTIWEDLSYSVVGIRVIAPDDFEAVRVREGLDLISLITCHPYGYNTHRYVVYCVRDGFALSDSAAKNNPDIFNSEATLDKSKGNVEEEIFGNPAVEDVLRIAGVAVLIACFCVVVARLRKR